MRSRSSAETVVNAFAVTSMEAAWLTLVYIGWQWIDEAPGLPLNILHFALAVALGIGVSWLVRQSSQRLYAVVVGSTAIAAVAAGGLIAGIPAPDPLGFVNSLFVNPSLWLLGLGVVRGSMQADAGSAYGTERVFGLGIPGLVVYWTLASWAGMTSNSTFTAAAFAATLTFVSAGLVALGLSRLAELDVESADRAARRRWLGLLIAVMAVVLIAGIPLGALLGLPVGSAIAGLLGPLGPLVFFVFATAATLIFAVLQAFGGLFGSVGQAPVPSIALPSAAAGGSPPPVTLPDPSGPPLVLDWLLVCFLVVGFVLLVRFLAGALWRPQAGRAAPNEIEVRANEPLVLPKLPSLPAFRRRGQRRATPRTAIEAYVFALEALAAGPSARSAHETPREHALRLQDGGLGRDVGRLAVDYQLDQFARRRLTTREVRRAIGRWRRIVERERPKR